MNIGSQSPDFKESRPLEWAHREFEIEVPADITDEELAGLADAPDLNAAVVELFEKRANFVGKTADADEHRSLKGPEKPEGVTSGYEYPHSRVTPDTPLPPPSTVIIEFDAEWVADPERPGHNNVLSYQWHVITSRGSYTGRDAGPNG